MLAVFIDLQKAFEKVWKDGLLVKLLRYGISGRMYNWIKLYLYNRRARVLVDGQCGRKVLLKQGVPQGRVLPPTQYERSNTRASKRCTYNPLCRRSCTLVHRRVCNHSNLQNANCFR